MVWVGGPKKVVGDPLSLILGVWKNKVPESIWLLNLTPALGMFCKTKLYKSKHLSETKHNNT